MRLKNCFYFVALSAALIFGVREAGARWLTLEVIAVQSDDSRSQARGQGLLRAARGQNLLSLNLRHWRERLRNIPGVADAELRRRLPHTLQVRLSSHRPLAKWEDGGLVDVDGRRFEGDSNEWLPVFVGPPARAVEMAEFYDDAQQLLRRHSLIIVQLHLQDNGEWRIFLQDKLDKSDGLTLYLGRRSPHRQLRRYLAYAKSLHRHFAVVRAVDLRYEKGFSVDGARRNSHE